MQNLKPQYQNLFNPYMLLPEIEPDRMLIPTGRARSRGLEISAGNRERNGRADARWLWRVNYSLAQVEDRVLERWQPRRFDQTHTFNGQITYRRGGFTASLATVWHSGWALTRLPPTLPADLDAFLHRHNSRLRN